MISALRPGLRRVALWSACALTLFATGCGEKTQSSADAKGPGGGKGGRGGGGGAAPVIVGAATKKKVPLVIDAIGSVEAIKSAGIRSQITGVLQKINFQEGQDVNAGDILFEIDPRPLRNALAVTQSDLEKLRVQLSNARAQVERYGSLQAGQMVSKEQFQKIQDDARALEAQVKSKESDVANAKLQLEYSAIRAPISGRTGNLAVHEGDLVRVNDTAPLVTINQLTPIYVTFGVPQQHVAALNRYRAEGALGVRAVPPGADDTAEKGELTFMDNVVDSLTGTIKLKATFDNRGHRLWPGQFASVTVTLAEPEVLTVPAAAIQNSQNGQHVFVVTADKNAELRPVVVERTFDNVAVIAKGLNEGETVVIDGQLRVVPGRPVDIKIGAGSASAGGGGARGEGKKGEGKKKKKDAATPPS